MWSGRAFPSMSVGTEATQEVRLRAAVSTERLFFVCLFGYPTGQEYWIFPVTGVGNLCPSGALTCSAQAT